MYTLTNLTTRADCVRFSLPAGHFTGPSPFYIWTKDLKSKNCNTFGELLIIFHLTERLFSSCTSERRGSDTYTNLIIDSDNPQRSPIRFLMGPACCPGNQACISVRVFDGAMAAVAPADPGFSGPLCSLFFCLPWLCILWLTELVWTGVFMGSDTLSCSQRQRA